jgi:exopolysaccharide biosynthesis polyprenyl glycosylphosphotransferase
MQMHQLVDSCVFALSFWLACKVRENAVLMDTFDLAPVSSFRSLAWLLLILIPAAPLVLEAQGFYARQSFCSRGATLWPLLKSCLIMSLGLVFMLYLFKVLIPRGVLVWFGVISFLLMLAKEELLRFISTRKLTHGQNKRRFLLVGTGEETARMRAVLGSHAEEGVEIPAELNLEEFSVDHLVGMLHEHSVNGVILSAKHANFEQVEAAIRACELEGIEAWLVADFFKTQISRTSFDDFFGRPVMVFRTTPEASWQSVLKTFIDTGGALLLLLLFSWLLAIVALIIKLTSPGPVLFRQQRSGLNGRPFTIYKFRTMVTDAEQRQHELAAMNEMTGPVFKIAKDPRITPFGRILRKFSIDEFPQLFNVLRGEMSLVGPRPLPVDEIKRIHDLAHRRRLSVRPGLTCLWQISGRNNVKDFKDWVRLDLEYIDNWSLWLDLKILVRTIPIVLIGSGAR